jgi:acetolactate synthase regulatory subunit
MSPISPQRQMATQDLWIEAAQAISGSLSPDAVQAKVTAFANTWRDSVEEIETHLYLRIFEPSEANAVVGIDVRMEISSAFEQVLDQLVKTLSISKERGFVIIVTAMDEKSAAQPVLMKRVFGILEQRGFNP